MALDRYTAAVLADSPRAYWKLDEALGTPQDSSGNGFHMTSCTATNYRRTGPYSDIVSLEFNGGEVATRASVATVFDNITVEMFFRPQLITANNQSFFGIDSGGQGWTLLIDTNGAWRGLVQGVAFLTDSPTLLVADTWYHLVVTRRSTTWKYYLNGSSDLANAGTTAPNTSPVDTYIHKGGFLQARYAHVAYYETSLSDDRIAAHFAAAQVPIVSQQGSMQTHVFGHGVW